VDAKHLPEGIAGLTVDFDLIAKHCECLAVQSDELTSYREKHQFYADLGSAPMICV